IALRGLLLGPDRTRLLVLVEIKSAAGQRTAFDRVFELVAHPLERRRAKLSVAVLELRVHRVPKILDEAVQHRKALIEPAYAVARDRGLGEPRCQLEIFALLAEPFRDQLDGERPVREFALAPPLALGRIVVLAAGFLDLVVEGGVAEIFSRGVGARDRS